MPNVEPLGARIQSLRRELGYTQDHLALRARVDQSGLSKFERGKTKGMGIVALTRVAEILGTTFEALVEGTDY